MIFNQFDPTDIVAGWVSRVDSGFWPEGTAFASQSSFLDNFFSLTQSITTPSPSFGASIYDIRYTMYYVNVYPDQTTFNNNDPYFSVTYGNYNCEASGSGDFNLDTASILANGPKAVYTQYQNLLLGEGETGLFQFASGSATNYSLVTAIDIFVVNFSSYKMKDKVDEGVFQMSISGANGEITVIDDSTFLTQASSVYNLIQGTVGGAATTPVYQGIGLFYPNNGVAVFNAKVVDQLVGLSNLTTIGPQPPTAPNGNVCLSSYSTQSILGINVPGTAGITPTTYNHEVFSWAIQNASNGIMMVRKSEYVPSQHYFVRVKNQNFNYSNNPTYVYDGTDGIHPAGLIYNQDFITNPTTYITTVGLYDANNELVAVAKLSRPAVKTFDNELLIKVRIDY
jgi:hypothetical protein